MVSTMLATSVWRLPVVAWEHSTQLTVSGMDSTQEQKSHAPNDQA